MHLLLATVAYGDQLQTELQPRDPWNYGTNAFWCGACGLCHPYSLQEPPVLGGLELWREDGWKLQIVKRRQRAFKIRGLTWIVERTFAWLGRNRRFSKDYEYRVQTSETLLDIAATRLMLNRLAPA
jgi:hypothetical protein